MYIYIYIYITITITNAPRHRASCQVLARLEIHHRGAQSEGGAADWGSIM